ncbi:MAG: hypothetical protein ACKOJF_21320, partial [Planctomycetaceae bacterium]
MSHSQRPSNRQLFVVGKLQKIALLLLVVSSVFLVAMLTLQDLPLRLVAFGVLVVVNIVNVIFIARLAKALKSPVHWLYVILGFFPGLAQVSLLILVIKSAVLLHAGGLNPGLLGVSNAQLESLRAPDQAAP